MAAASLKTDTGDGKKIGAIHPRVVATNHSNMTLATDAVLISNNISAEYIGRVADKRSPPLLDESCVFPSTDVWHCGDLAIFEHPTRQVFHLSGMEFHMLSPICPAEILE